MSSIITNNFRYNIAESFITSLYENNVYIFISRSQKWNSEEYANNPAVSDTAAPTPVANLDEYSRIHDNMIAIKKLDPSLDIARVIKKISWKEGRIYDMYKHNYSIINPTASGATTLADSLFYVVNSQFQVFKCIYNGQTPETPLGIPTVSGSEPVVTGSPTTIITTSDGYRWKFMYSIDTQKVLSFANNNYIPIYNDATVTSAAIPGTIDQINITNRGNNLTSGIYYTKVLGNGSGAIAKITIPNDNANQFNQKISSISLVSVGHNYTYAYIDLTKVYSNIECTLSTTISTALATLNYYAEPIVAPLIGHGGFPETELEYYRVALAPKLTSVDGDVPVNISYRQYGLLSNPITDNSTQVFSDVTGNTAYKVNIPSGFTGSFANGDKITQSNTNAVGVVIAWDSVNKVLTYYQNAFTNAGNITPFSGTNIITSASGIAATPNTSFSGTLVNSTYVFGYAKSEIKKYSGDIWYIESRSSTINRSQDQEERILLILEF